MYKDVHINIQLIYIHTMCVYVYKHTYIHVYAYINELKYTHTQTGPKYLPQLIFSKLTSHGSSVGHLNFQACPTCP